MKIIKTANYKKIEKKAWLPGHPLNESEETDDRDYSEVTHLLQQVNSRRGIFDDPIRLRHDGQDELGFGMFSLVVEPPTEGRKGPKGSNPVADFSSPTPFKDLMSDDSWLDPDRMKNTLTSSERNFINSRHKWGLEDLIGVLEIMLENIQEFGRVYKSQTEKTLDSLQLKCNNCGGIYTTGENNDAQCPHCGDRYLNDQWSKEPYDPSGGSNV